MAFDCSGKEVCDTFHEVHVIFSEFSPFSRVRPKNTPGVFDGADDDADAADNIVINEQVGTAKPVFRAEVINNNWFLGEERIPGLRV